MSFDMNVSQYNSKQKMKHRRREVYNIEEEPETKHLCSFKHNISTEINVKEGTQKAKEKAGSVQSVAPAFINSYISFVKNRNKNVTLHIPPERNLPYSTEIDHLKSLGRNSGVSETVGETNYLKERKKKKHYHSSNLENVIHNDSSLEENGSMEVTVISSSKLNSPVNRTAISLENKLLEGKKQDLETDSGTHYFKKRKRKKHYNSSGLENVIHNDSSLEKDTSMKATEISSSELSSPVNKRTNSLENKLLKKNCEVSESVSESRFLKKRKRNKPYDSSELENMIYDDLPLKKYRSLEAVEISSSKLSSPVNRTSISSVNKLLKKNFEVAETVSGTHYLKKERKKKKHYVSSGLENVIHDESSLEKDRSVEATEISSSELSTPVKKRYISSENKMLKKNCEVSETVGEINCKMQGKKKKRNDSSRLDNVVHDVLSLEKNRSMAVTEISSSELSSSVNRTPISTENKLLKENFEVTETDSGTRSLMKRKEKKHCDSLGLENAIHDDSSLKKDRSMDIPEVSSSELNSPVNKKSISSDNKYLKKYCDVSLTDNGTHYLKKKKKKKCCDSSGLENVIHYDSSPEKDRSMEVIEISTSGGSPVNNTPISSENKLLKKNYEVAEIVDETSYLKKRKKKKRHDSSRIENVILNELSLEKGRSVDEIEINSSEISSPESRTSIFTENMFLKKHCEVSETDNGTHYLNKRKKKKRHVSSRLEDVSHNVLSPEKNKIMEITEKPSLELSSPLERTSISSENSVSSIPFKRVYKKSEDFQAYESINNELFISENKFPVSEMASNTSLNMIIGSRLKEKKHVLKMSPEHVSERRSSVQKQKSNNLITCEGSEINSFSSLLSPSHETRSCIDKKFKNVIHLSNGKIHGMVEEVNFENYISSSKKKMKLQKNNSLMNKCENNEHLPTVLNRKKVEQSHTNHSTPIIDDIDADCLEERNSSTSFSGRITRKREKFNTEHDMLNLKKKMKEKTNRNATDISVIEPSPSLLFTPAKNDEKRKKKDKHAIWNESNISLGEYNDNLHISGRELPFEVTNEILEKNIPNLSFQTPKKIKEKNNISVCEVSSDTSHSVSCKRSKERIHTKQNATKIDFNDSVNTVLFSPESKSSSLSNKQSGMWEEINTECSVTSKMQMIPRERSRNNKFHPEPESSSSSQSSSCKRKMKHNHRNENDSHNSWKEGVNLSSSDTESPVKTVKTKTKEKGANSESSMIKPKNNKLNIQTNNVTACNKFERSPSSVLLSSSEEINEHINTNSNELIEVDSDDEFALDFFSRDTKRVSSMELLNFYAKKIGNKREECDKIWDDAVMVKSSSYNKFEIHVNISHDIPSLHLCENLVCSVPKEEEREKLIALGMKETPFNKCEDDIIMKNWKQLCEDNEASPSELLPIIMSKSGGGYKRKERIIQYLGNGLPNRALYLIYNRFILLSHTKRGRFSEEEDYLILKAMNSDVKEQYSLLSAILNRSRNTIYKRYQTILKSPRDDTGECNKIKVKWDKILANRVVKSLMHISGASSIDDFKDAVISLDVWRDVEKDLKIPYWKLYQYWCYRLHVQLFAETPVIEKQIQQKIVQWLHRQKYSTEQDIRWAESVRLFSGSTTMFMWLQFRKVRNNFQFQNFKGLRDFIDAVYAQENAFVGPSRYIPRYKVGDDFLLSVIIDKNC